MLLLIGFATGLCVGGLGMLYQEIKYGKLQMSYRDFIIEAIKDKGGE
jgi:hypothetical protein